MTQQWVEAYMQSTQAWVNILPYLLMDDQVHGLNRTQRELMDNMAVKYSEALQRTFNLYLQSFSLQAETSERYMDLVNKMLGIKT